MLEIAKCPARERFETWREKVIKRVNRQQHLVGWAEVERLQNKLDTLTELQEKMKAVNKIVRNGKLSEIEQHEELEAIGLSARTINEVMRPLQNLTPFSIILVFEHYWLTRSQYF